MLSIILKILSIIGILLLVLLGTGLVLLLVVLFLPVHYCVKGERYAQEGQAQCISEENCPVVNKAECRMWWLLGLLRAEYRYPVPGKWSVKFLFFTIWRSGTITPQSEISQIREKTLEEGPKQEKTQEQKVEELHGQETSQKQEGETTSFERDNWNGLSLSEKIQYTISKFYDKISNIGKKLGDICKNAVYYKEVLTGEETRAALKHIRVRIGKIWKNMRPGKLLADVRIGASSPDVTGYICALYGILGLNRYKKVNFTPDFEQEILQGYIYAAGHITVFCVLWNSLWLVKDPVIRRFTEKFYKI